ncbi:hypothetical protein HDR61_04015 [bacterium]|nr:hypothetical protein [bacterium]
MKVKNIAFSGFAAAILLAGGVADAATPQIASKQYVDSKLADKATVGAVTALGSRVDTVEADLGTKENASNKTTVITDGNKNSTTAFPTVGAITTWAEGRITSLSELPVNPSLIEDNTLDGTKLKDDSVSKDKLDPSVKDALDKANTALQTQTQANWTETDTTSAAFINNKPALATVATSGSYGDLNNKPTIDSELSTTSENAVQNKVVTTKINDVESVANAALPASDVNADVNWALPDMDMYSDTKVPSEKAVAAGFENMRAGMQEYNASFGQYISTKADLADNASDAKDGNIATVDASGQYTVSDVNINAVATKADVDAVKEVADATIPMPTGACAAESGRCVLSIASQGGKATLQWMDITAPLGE